MVSALINRRRCACVPDTRAPAIRQYSGLQPGIESAMREGRACGPCPTKCGLVTVQHPECLLRLHVDPFLS